MVRIRGARIALFDRTCNILSNRASPRTVSVLPSQTILLAGSADDALSILIHVVTRALLKRVVILRFHITVAHMDGINFIGADPAIQQFLPSRTANERQFPFALDQRHGKWPGL